MVFDSPSDTDQSPTAHLIQVGVCAQDLFVWLVGQADAELAVYLGAIGLAYLQDRANVPSPSPVDVSRPMYS